jgi:large subunit ribosomal protein L15
MAEPRTETAPAAPAGLHELAPAPGARRTRKRVGRGPGSGTGKTSGRGHKGQKARAGSHRMRAGFVGGQNPLQMQLGKQRGSTKKMSMPMGPFRTFTQGVNVSVLAARFEKDAEVTPETLLAAGVLRHLRHPVKILGNGELDHALVVRAHGFSAGARQKIEAAGGSVTVIGADEALAEVEVEIVAEPEPAPAEEVSAEAEASAEDDAPADEAEAEAAPEAEAEAAADEETEGEGEGS